MTGYLLWAAVFVVLGSFALLATWLANRVSACLHIPDPPQSLHRTGRVLPSAGGVGGQTDVGAHTRRLRGHFTIGRT